MATCEHFAAFNGTAISTADAMKNLGVTVTSTFKTSCSADPVPASPEVCGSDTRDLSASVPGSGETNLGVRPASVLTVPSTRHSLDGAQTAPGDSYGQRHEGTAIQRTTSSTEPFLLSSSAVMAETLSSPTTSSMDALISRMRNLSRSQWNGTYEGMTQLSPQLSFTAEESSLLRQASWSVEQSPKSHCQCPIVRRFQAVSGRCMAVTVPRPSLIPLLDD